MVTLVKHEWHSVDSQFALELDQNLLGEIYPDKNKKELKKLLKDIENGEVDVEEIVSDAYDNDVDLEWDRQYDDWWTDRKGGYDVTYELGDENSWHTTPEDLPPTHKCTKCRWTGRSYDTGTLFLRADGSVIENFYESDEESDHTSEICPMCDSPVELTPEGVKEAEETKKRMAEIDAMFSDEEEISDE